MSSASVNGVVTDMNVIAAGTIVSAKNKTSNQDFGQFMSQAKDKVDKTSKINETQRSQKQKKVTGNEKTENEAFEKYRNKNDSNVTSGNENVSNKNLKDEAQNKNTVSTVEEGAKEVAEAIQEQLNISEEDLEQAMEVLGLQLIDLLNADNLKQLVAELAGEGSMMGLVTDESLYDTLQNLIEVIDTQSSELMEELDLNEDEFEVLLSEISECKDNIISFETAMNEAIEPDAETAVETEEIPVIVSEDKEQTAKVQTEVSTEAENMAQQNTERVKSENKADTNSTDYKNAENGFAEQMNTSQEMQEVAEVANENFDIPDTEHILKQIADYVKVQSSKEITEMELQLHPASLGSVHIQLSTKGGIVTAQFTAENENVKHAIETQAVQLRSNLEEQGVKVEAIEVSVGTHQFERNLEQNSHNQQKDDEAGKTQKIQKMRRANINLRALESGEGLGEELDESDDATRIAMELMTANGNSLDLLA